MAKWTIDACLLCDNGEMNDRCLFTLWQWRNERSMLVYFVTMAKWTIDACLLCDNAKWTIDACLLCDNGEMNDRCFFTLWQWRNERSMLLYFVTMAKWTLDASLLCGNGEMNDRCFFTVTMAKWTIDACFRHNRVGSKYKIACKKWNNA